MREEQTNGLWHLCPHFMELSDQAPFTLIIRTNPVNMSPDEPLPTLPLSSCHNDILTFQIFQSTFFQFLYGLYIMLV